jgi:hypothetical protein
MINVPYTLLNPTAGWPSPKGWRWIGTSAG